MKPRDLLLAFALGAQACSEPQPQEHDATVEELRASYAQQKTRLLHEVAYSTLPQITITDPDPQPADPKAIEAGQRMVRYLVKHLTEIQKIETGQDEEKTSLSWVTGMADFAFKTNPKLKKTHDQEKDTLYYEIDFQESHEQAVRSLYQYINFVNNYLEANNYHLVWKDHDKNGHQTCLVKLVGNKKVDIRSGLQHFTSKASLLGDTHIDINNCQKRKTGFLLGSTAVYNPAEILIFIDGLQKEKELITTIPDFDEHGKAVPKEDLTKLTDDVITHEVNHLLNGMVFSVLKKDPKFRCTYYEENQEPLIISVADIDEESARGLEMALSRSTVVALNGMSYASYSDQEVESPFIDLALNLLIFSPNNHYRQSLLKTEAETGWRKYLEAIALYEQPNFNIEQTHQIGQQIYFRTQRILQSCQAEFNVQQANSKTAEE